MLIICPQCQGPIDTGDGTLPDEVVCPSCGSRFRLDRGSTTGHDGVPSQLGRFALLGVLGRGAFGTVWKARDPQLDRVVALKVPRADQLADDPARDRFLREARSAAQLRHPAIVPVHEVGEASGSFYLVSEFVEGVTLADLLSARRLPPRETAGMLADVADALHYAHEQGVVHRDAKPSNVMVGADGKPRIMDFGLAKREAGEVTMTTEGQVLGTPAYMAPEQARGEAHRVDRRADVYSLGVMLYQLLTGELPFRGTVRMLLHQVLHDEPRPPRRLNDAIPRDLETICLKAMAKEPGGRYPTAKALADDLRRWLGGMPIQARPVGRVEKVWRWCRRNPAVAALGMAVAVISAIGIVSFAWAYGRAVVALTRADVEKRDRLRKQVEQLKSADPRAVPDLLAALEPERAEALPHIRALYAAGGDGRTRFALALLPDQPSLRDELSAAMLAAADPREMLLIRDTLTPFAADLSDDLWHRANDKTATADARFRALVALAAFAPDSPHWKDAAGPTVELLLRQPSVYLDDWRTALRPVAASLITPLGDVFRGKVQADKRQIAAEVLADYAADDAVALADLAAGADAEQFALLVPLLQRHRERAAALLEKDVGHTLAPSWSDAPLDPG